MNSHVTLHVDSPDGQRTLAASGELSLAELLRRHELPLNTRCGQRGICDGCLVELTQGTLVHVTTAQSITANGAPMTIRACEYKAADPTTNIRIPPRSLLGHRPQVLTDFRIGVPVAHDPLGDGPDHSLSVAIDVGTTTIVVLLVDRNDGNIVGKASAFNRQMDHGDDVLTRINLCSTDPAALDYLQRAVAQETIALLVKDALNQTGRPASDIACVTAAGNTTMLHILAGVDPSSMGFAPFTPTFLEHRTISGESLGLSAPIHLLPSAAAYIGADLVAGILASGLIYDDGPSLLVDIGTNGEIIAKHGNRLIGCATAAGPAFEGSRLACGMRAAQGAVSHVRVSRDPLSFDVESIGEGKPIGLCGSAYIDLLADLRRTDLLLPAGRFNLNQRSAMNGQLITIDRGHAMCIARGLGAKDVTITEPDIAAILQAKAAIAAGILTLLDHLKVNPEQVKTLYLAGGFGMHLDIPNAIACGLLPGFTPKQVQLVGNTSLAGAYLALLDKSILAELESVRQGLEVIELNLDPEFESRYIDQLTI